jgi:hypothetical protein
MMPFGYEEVFRSLLLAIAGFSAGVVATALTRIVFGSSNYKRRFAELERERDKAMIELLTRPDVTEYEKARGEVGITREFARQLEALDQRVAATSKVLQWFAAIGGVVGIGIAIAKFRDLFSERPNRTGWIDLLVSPASAADGMKPDLAPFIPYIAMFILGLMALSFVVSLGVLLFLPDKKENQARIKAADNIVKTFGGFFTGLATTLLR